MLMEEAYWRITRKSINIKTSSGPTLVHLTYFMVFSSIQEILLYKACLPVGKRGCI